MMRERRETRVESKGENSNPSIKFSLTISNITLSKLLNESPKYYSPMYLVPKL